MSKRMIQMLAAIAVFIVVIGYVKFTQIQAAIAMGKSFAPPPDAVTTVIAKPAAWSATIEAIGSIAAVQGVTLSADQPGTVARIGFESGQRVKAGDKLVELDARQERAMLASAEAQRDVAQAAFERARKLFGEHLVSQAEYDQAEAQAKQATAALQKAVGKTPPPITCPDDVDAEVGKTTTCVMHGSDGDYNVAVKMPVLMEYGRARKSKIN